MAYLKYNSRNMMFGKVSEYGAKQAEIKKLHPRLKKANQNLDNLSKKQKVGFLKAPYDLSSLKEIQKTADGLTNKFKNLIIVGIGGSDLGARAIWQALQNQRRKNGVELIFSGSNADPETLHQLLQSVNFKNTAINVISKSGSTIETLSTFLILQKALIKKVGAKKHSAHIFVTTETNGNPLHRIAKQEGYQILVHPQNIGGRFSVLSVVGLFPAACAGIDIRAMLKGARTIENERLRLKDRSEPAKFAVLHYLAYEKRQQRLHVLMPYSDALAEFAKWYRQLWAESLAKIKGERNIGPTPIAALGATDQHSQLQLYTQGPADKVFTFIIPKLYRNDIKIPKKYAKFSEISYFLDKKLSQIIRAEQKGTEQTLTKVKMPNGTIEIPKISPESLGALFQFYETATAFMGELFEINAYNQPGVALGKKLTKQILSKN